MTEPYTYPYYLKEICSNCGCTKGAHHAGTSPWPYDYCPGQCGAMDWDNNHDETKFYGSGEYEE